MTKSASLNLRRSFATIFCATTIFVLSIFSIYAAYFFALFASCVLGSLQGAGAVGLFMLAWYFTNFQGISEGTIQMTSIFIIFVTSLLAGIIAGCPFEFEKKFDKKRWLRNFVSLMVAYGALNVATFIFFKKTLLIFSIFCTAVSLPLLAIFRPIVAKLLFPQNALEKEAQELVEKLKKKKSKSRKRRK